VALAHFGWADVARRPVQEPRADALFERLNMLADHRGREPEVAGSRGETLRFHHFGEHGHADEAVHGPPYCDLRAELNTGVEIYLGRGGYRGRPCANRASRGKLRLTTPAPAELDGPRPCD